MGILKAVPVLIAIAVLLAGMTAMSVSARIEARWALQAGDVTAGEDISIEHPMAQLFHQQVYSASDRENYKLSFPITADGLGLGPTSVSLGGVDNDLGIDTSATSNILPFGPVNLAFPNIHEDVDQTVSTSSTGFFHANWAFIADTVGGNQGSAPLGISFSAIQPFKCGHLLGSEFLWPYMIPRASASSGELGLDVNSLAPGTIPDVPSLATDLSIIGKNQLNITRGSGPTSNAPNNTGEKLLDGWGQRKPRIDPKMTREAINNTTDMQRLYRNAFIGSTMCRAYEGTTQYPTWIDPYDNGRGVFNQLDMQKILKLALKKTQPGEHIAPVFWDL